MLLRCGFIGLVGLSSVVVASCGGGRASESAVVEQLRTRVHDVLEKLDAIDAQRLDEQPLVSLHAGATPVCNFGLGVAEKSAAAHEDTLHQLGTRRTDDAGIGSNQALRVAYAAVMNRKFVEHGQLRALSTDAPEAHDGHVTIFRSTLEAVAGLKYVLVLHTAEFRSPPAAPAGPAAEFQPGRITFEVRVWELASATYVGGFSAWAENSPAAGGHRGPHFAAMLERDLDTNARAALQTACIGWGGGAPHRNRP